MSNLFNLGKKPRPPKRHDGRIILHFDYDCFYAACFEIERPELRQLPLAVQQKQIVVTCNYPARRLGVHKLQLIADARRQCPDLIVVLGEDLTRFRDHSKDNYLFLASWAWSGRAERLGMDEVWLDVTDIVNYNVSLLNSNDLKNSFMYLDQQNLTKGFSFDARRIVGPICPENANHSSEDDIITTSLNLRLLLGSHLAKYLREQLEISRGFTSTVGVSSNKVLSKLVGNVNKPNNQTTLIGPYSNEADGVTSNVQLFLDPYEIRKLPGIGFRTAQLLRKYVLGHEAGIESGLIYGATKENVTVREVLESKQMGPMTLDNIFSNSGLSKDIGYRVWCLLHGVDESEVEILRDIPLQISIEDTYLHLKDEAAVLCQLKLLLTSLIRRMRKDLTQLDNSPRGKEQVQWKALPKSLRLSVRERTAERSFARITKTERLPQLMLDLIDEPGSIAAAVTQSTLLPMFRQLIPPNRSFDLNLVNVAVAEISLDEGRGKDGQKLNIIQAFQQPGVSESGGYSMPRSGENFQDNGFLVSEQVLRNAEAGVSWSESEWSPSGSPLIVCTECETQIPVFALAAHRRFHTLGVDD